VFADSDVAMTDVGAGEGRPVVVVPCYNEALRLDETSFMELARSGRVELLFVDDGSNDETAEMLRRLTKEADALDVLSLPANVGKAEAVRRGMRHAIDGGAAVVGYCDADLSTPPRELVRLLDRLGSDGRLAAVFGSRVARLGSRIQRSAFRHYAGRMYATLASAALGMTVYDTQCGAKVFRVTPELVAALDTPFSSRWGFDVALCHRLRSGTETCAGLPDEAFLEEPLELWHDVSGSKLNVAGTLRAVADVLGLGLARLARKVRDRFSGYRARSES
jgi:glycosyltransferase involved in cell wall biosynthesis